jgi:hypothetical protein
VENTPNTFSFMEEGSMKRGPGLGNMSGITHSLEEDSITASSADQREEELGMFWSYILGILTNLESLLPERIYQMLRIFAMQEHDSMAEVQKLKRDWKIVFLYPPPGHISRTSLLLPWPLRMTSGYSFGWRWPCPSSSSWSSSICGSWPTAPSPGPLGSVGLQSSSRTRQVELQIRFWRPRLAGTAEMGRKPWRWQTTWWGS